MFFVSNTKRLEGACFTELEEAMKEAERLNRLPKTLKAQAMGYLTGSYLVLARFGDLPIGTRVSINQRSGIKTTPRPVSSEAVTVRSSLKGMVWNWLEEGLWEHWRSICDFEAVEIISLP